MELTHYEAAGRYLDGVMNGRTGIPLKAWKAEQEKLTAERKELSRRYLALKDEVKEAEQIRKGVYSILREENRKEQPAHKQDLERWKTATQRVKCPAWPTALCLSHHNRTNGLIRSAGLSFISISAGSTFFNPWNLCVMSFSG